MNFENYHILIHKHTIEGLWSAMLLQRVSEFGGGDPGQKMHTKGR